MSSHISVVYLQDSEHHSVLRDEHGDTFYTAGDLHAEIDAINENVFDPLTGEVAVPLFLHGLFLLKYCDLVVTYL